MTLENPTRDETLRLADFLCKEFDCRIVDKAKDPEMAFIARFLSTFGIMNANTFLQSYSTTIPDFLGPNKALIALNFIPGDSSFSLYSQCRVMIHECACHAAQIQRDGKDDFAMRYLLSLNERMLYELDGYASGLELDFHAGFAPDPEHAAECLRPYGFDDSWIAMARAELQSRCLTFAQGGTTPEMKKVLNWWGV